MTRADVVILGLGPAGRAAAVACADAGLSVVALDPAPDRPWTATYGAWTDELHPAVPVAAQVDRPVAWTTRRQVLARGYTVLDSLALQASLDLGEVTVRAVRGEVDTGASRDGDTVIRCTDGSLVRAAVVLDARGAPATGRTQQTAHGVVLPREVAEPVLDGAQALFMDWRRMPGTDGAPTFLYALPLDAERVLVEETCLARRPGLGLAELRRRLEVRLREHGVRLRGDERVERVRFALDTPLPAREWGGRTPVVPRLGAAAPLVHPATGYSVATSLRLAPLLAAACTAERPVRAVQRVLWSPRSRAVHALRLRGLRVLLGLAPEQVPEFFAAFLDLPLHHQRAYLTGRDSPAAVAAAMAALLPGLSRDLRGAVVGGAGLNPGSRPRAPAGR